MTLFSQQLIDRVSTMTREDVAKLPRVHIPNEGILNQLLAWRDANKDLVRNYRPLILEGTISVLDDQNFQYFNVDGRDVLHMNVTTPTQYSAFTQNMDTWEVTPIAHTIEFYDRENATADMITLHATIMAYLEHIGKINIGNYFEIKEVSAI